MNRPLLLTDALGRAERLFGPSEGVVDGDIRFTWAEFGVRARRLAAGLRRLGVGKGDRVATLLSNGHHYLAAYAAIPALGAVIVPLNTRLSAAELEAILADSGAGLLLADEATRDLVGGLSGAVPRVLTMPDDEADLYPSRPLPDFDEPIDEDDLAAIFYTGGTTGPAKGVMLSHRNLVANAFNMTIGAGYRQDDVFLHAAPMFHLADGSSIYALTWIGARHVFVPRFDPALVLETLRRERVTVTILIPTMITALVHHPAATTADFRHQRLVLHGGAAMPADLLRRAVDVMRCSFTQAYGMTESSALATMLHAEETLLDSKWVRTAGQSVMGIDLSVRRPDGTECVAGEVGEIALRGPTIMRGYWHRPEETAACMRDGWFRTGDVGSIDGEGYLTIIDRVRDMIKSGSEQVYSGEVEAVVCDHPAVLEAAVIGLPDETWGERVHAVVVTRPDHTLALDELRSFCKTRLAGYKCPRSLEIVESLPKSGAGKVLKRELRDRSLDGANVKGGRDA